MCVYDFDGTIYDGDSTLDFWKYCLLRHPLAAITLISSIWGLLLYFLGVIPKNNFKQRFYSFLKFVPNVDQQLNSFWVKHRKNIKPWYLKQRKSTDIIISASPEFLLKPICGELEVRLIASIVDKHTGICISENCYGYEKINRLRSVYPDAIVEEFYSDSASDKPLADIAVKAFYVCGEQILPWNNRH